MSESRNPGSPSEPPHPDEGLILRLRDCATVSITLLADPALFIAAADRLAALNNAVEITLAALHDEHEERVTAQEVARGLLARIAAVRALCDEWENVPYDGWPDAIRTALGTDGADDE